MAFSRDDTWRKDSADQAASKASHVPLQFEPANIANQRVCLDIRESPFAWVSLHLIAGHVPRPAGDSRAEAGAAPSFDTDVAGAAVHASKLVEE